MIELFFPVVGALVVFLLAVPVLTLVARALIALAPQSDRSVDDHVRGWRFALIVGPTLGPIVWLVSATIHQSETGEPLAACIVDHLGSDTCRDVVFFGLVLSTILGAGVLRRIGHPGPRRERGSRSAGPALVARVLETCEHHPLLAAFAGRIRVVDRGAAPVCTRGLLRPRVELQADVVRSLSGQELAAVLLHEVEHAHSHDPLRYFVAQVALAINPLGLVLAPVLARYTLAREALCDRRAVQLGADPLALARSIVAVASPRPLPLAAAGLGGPGIDGVRLRVHLLLGYATRSPGPATRRSPRGSVASCIVVLAVLPHVMGTAPLDMLHHGVERMALLLGLG